MLVAPLEDAISHAHAVYDTTRGGLRQSPTFVPSTSVGSFAIRDDEIHITARRRGRCGLGGCSTAL